MSRMAKCAAERQNFANRRGGIGELDVAGVSARFALRGRTVPLFAASLLLIAFPARRIGSVSRIRRRAQENGRQRRARHPLSRCLWHSSPLFCLSCFACLAWYCGAAPFSAYASRLTHQAVFANIGGRMVTFAAALVGRCEINKTNGGNDWRNR
jgi:hypothetical protein